MLPPLHFKSVLCCHLINLFNCGYNTQTSCSRASMLKACVSDAVSRHKPRSAGLVARCQQPSRRHRSRALIRLYHHGAKARRPLPLLLPPIRAKNASSLSKCLLYAHRPRIASSPTSLLYMHQPIWSSMRKYDLNQRTFLEFFEQRRSQLGTLEKWAQKYKICQLFLVGHHLGSLSAK